MELTELKDRIISSFSGSNEDLEEVLAIVEQDQAIFPLNEYEHLICNLIERGGMSKPSWEDAPVWAQWSAQEENGHTATGMKKSINNCAR